jgi:hypothetical protein
VPVAASIRRPGGLVIDACPAAPRSHHSALRERNRRRLGSAALPRAHTCVPRYGGEKLDLDIAVEGLLQHRSRGP